ncbi:NADH-quinone oxidoreductase subunit H [Salmonella enterica subsp. enterica]|nr:NADH-quinone oxidoreductase subunit H [Salmonella enterica subsp. enterica]
MSVFFKGDLIALIYLFAIARFFFSIAGTDTGGPFTAIGASREAMLGVLVEFCCWVCGSPRRLRVQRISAISPSTIRWPVARSVIPLILALCACAFATFIPEMGKLPFGKPWRKRAGVAGRAVDRNTAVAALRYLTEGHQLSNWWCRRPFHRRVFLP